MLATGMPPSCSVSEPTPKTTLVALAGFLLFVAITRLPVARTSAFDFDEIGYLQTNRESAFPMHHTLFLASARVIGQGIGDPYRGFVLLDVFTSGLALAAVWWWLRAIVGPETAIAATLALGVSPVFWAYGAMAANYTAIPLVGSLLLGMAWRGRNAPKAWHPYAAAVALAMGTGYRQDIGTLWLPVFAVILWQHRWMAALQASLLFCALNLAWLIPMLYEAGGLAAYLNATKEFAEKAGYQNSVWSLGLIDATLRNAVKAALALGWALGLGLLFVPRGLFRATRQPNGWCFTGLLVLSALPAVTMHLLIHFGVAGYSFHYVPAVIALIALGAGPASSNVEARDRKAALRMTAVAVILAAVFVFYPTDLNRRGFRGDFDKTVARLTRIGLQSANLKADADIWRTANSQRLPDNKLPVPAAPRSSLAENSALISTQNGGSTVDFDGGAFEAGFVPVALPGEPMGATLPEPGPDRA